MPPNVPRDMAAWVIFWAGFAALDLWADHHGRSLCATTRATIRTDTRAGRAVFTAAYGTAAMSLYRHVLKSKETR